MEAEGDAKEVAYTRNQLARTLALAGDRSHERAYYEQAMEAATLASHTYGDIGDQAGQRNADQHVQRMSKKLGLDSAK
jgi:hypothetical protein